MRTRKPSPQQSHQRELSWALYITEGAAANMGHAILVNSYTLPRSDLALLKSIHRQQQQMANALRQRLSNP